jgi:tetraacyldisaccharide 4'-kinase
MHLKYRRNIIVRIILYPFAAIYCLLIFIRNTLFNHRFLQIKRYTIPIISVGNITAGGSGKTPFIIYLIGLLRRDYKKIAVVSRGYKRSSKGLVIVSDGNGDIATIKRAGDEPVLIAKKFEECVVIVCKKRTLGVSKAIDDFSCDLVLLDDAFQHRWIDRDCDIVLINAKQPISEQHLLPAGNLREPFSQIRRADMIIFTHVEDDLTKNEIGLINKYYSGPIFNCNHSPEHYLDIHSGNTYSLDYFKNKPVMAFCGIAQPQLFKDTLIQQDVDLKDFIIFSDHYNYTNSDLMKMSRRAKKMNCHYIITTEKDLIKISEFKNVNQVLFLGLIMKIIVKDEINLYHKIKEYIDKKIKNG